ncbi:MAG: nucleoside monophosphate kinase [Patescibacteria group bacterium]|nr:nucleoside monophosphate kinase [Patescibacteria group bacterium]
MPPQAFVFIGRSGSGKGTQAELLMKALKAAPGGRDSLYIQTGAELRNFIKGPTYTEKVAKKLYDTGALMAEFLTIDMWARALVDRYTGAEHLVFDGTPRKLHEAQVFMSIFEFYNLPKPWVIHIEVSKDESIKRLMARRRQDDRREEIEKRLSWFETEVVPVLEYFDTRINCNFLRIDGDRPAADIHADIVKRIGLA